MCQLEQFHQCLWVSDSLLGKHPAKPPASWMWGASLVQHRKSCFLKITLCQIWESECSCLKLQIWLYMLKSPFMIFLSCFSTIYFSLQLFNFFIYWLTCSFAVIQQFVSLSNVEKHCSVNYELIKTRNYNFVHFCSSINQYYLINIKYFLYAKWLNEWMSDCVILNRCEIQCHSEEVAREQKAVQLRCQRLILKLQNLCDSWEKWFGGKAYKQMTALVLILFFGYNYNCSLISV